LEILVHIRSRRGIIGISSKVDVLVLVRERERVGVIDIDELVVEGLGIGVMEVVDVGVHWAGEKGK